MKKKILFGIATGIAISLTTFTACNQQDNASDADENVMENSTMESSENLAALKEELKDVGTEIEKLTKEESAEFKAEAEAVIAKVKQRINTFENQAEVAGEEISASTRTAIDSLEHQAVRIESKLRVLGETTEEKAAEFREELKHDFSNLGESISDFFEKNS